MRYLKVVLVLGLISVIVGTLCLAQEAKRIAKIVDLEGDVQVKVSKDANWTIANIGMVLNETNIIKTAKDSWVLINLDGEGETASIELKENSQLMLSELTKNKELGTQKTLLDLAIGKVLIRAKKLHSEESSFEVKTPTSIVGVRGTVFEVNVEALE